MRYTEDEWRDEIGAPGVFVDLPGGRRFAFGTGIPCPRCGTVGFYGARVAPVDGPAVRKYRACKFCGFWQEAWGDLYDERGGEPYRCIMVRCSECHTYDWRLPWGPDDLGTCTICRNPDLRQAAWPTEDPSHPFHAIKAQIGQKQKQR